VGNIIGVMTLGCGLAALAIYFWVQQARLGRAQGASRVIALAMGVLAAMALIDGLWSVRQYSQELYGVPTPRVDTALYVGYLFGLALVAYGLVRWIPLLRALDDEATRRAQAEARLSGALDRMREFNNAMESLGEAYAAGQVDVSALSDAVIHAVAEALDVERVSFWTLVEDDRAIICNALLVRSTGEVERGHRLERAEHPAYFEAMLHSRALVAADAGTHPATSSFRDAYLTGNRILSLLDAPVRTGPGVRGVVCCESVGERRDWTPDEVSIAAAGAQFIGMAYMAEDARALTQDVRRALIAAEEASTAKSEFLARMSHEIRTPLNGVLGMARLLANDIDEPKAAMRLEVIQKSGETLLSQLNDVLDVSRIEAGVIRIAPAPMDLGALVEEVRALFVPTAAEKGLRLDALIEPGSHRALVADAGRVRQCLVNLVANGIKFTEEGSVSIRAETRPAGDDRVQVLLEVQDTGPGVPADQHESIFAPFTQTDEGAARRHGGAGLGLTIVRRLARMMGGDASVVSREGEGARFIVTFNAGLERESGAVGDVGALSGADALRGRRVLVVDDNSVNLAVAEEFLRVLGAEVRAAEGGEAALALLREEASELIFLDVHMPGMDGLEVLRAIRSGAAGPADVPVIALTADAMVGDRERYLAEGMDGYLSKPVDFDQLALEAGRVLAAADVERRSA